MRALVRFDGIGNWQGVIAGPIQIQLFFPYRDKAINEFSKVHFLILNSEKINLIRMQRNYLDSLDTYLGGIMNPKRIYIFL